ncbi:TetR family transcriptional regulator [Mycobacterium sp. Root265]|uniref:TetR/AcrR family transcriptional regulator n=1 Tax=Mycobacterium sp. Root265 TaxID=1736504 RepID=UPI00070B0DBA|nr:TetR/AcrR family transcriptional regulator [Mycobacterium sp. Root265]KRD06954.1 TetR family transcriptional regulator [Mycobacterium sp. Root265]
MDGEPKTRRRNDALMTAIRDAVRAELTEHGYAALTFEGVARRAKTSKPVLYRRYRTRAHMVVDALPNLRWEPDDLVFDATESLRENLLTLFAAIVDNFVAIGVDNYRRLVADADDDLLDLLHAQIIGLAERTVYPALARARERDEIGPREISRLPAMSIGYLLRDRLLFTRAEVGRDAIAEILDTVYLPLISTVSRL